MKTHPTCTWFVTAIALILSGYSCFAQQPAPTAPVLGTKLVLLGTGTPPADPDRSGPASAVVVNGTPYLVDFGAGVVRRAKAAVAERGIEALDPVKLRVVFLTHMHSDHTVGYPDLILTPWVLGRREPLEVYGPAGIKDMTTHILEAYRVESESRAKQREDGVYTVGTFPAGREVRAHEIKPGLVYQDANVKVTAFATVHTMESYAYRFETADRTIVFSGDTNPSAGVLEACQGCDILVHEVLTHDWLSRRPDFTEYARRYHTTTTQLAELARKAKPKLLVLYHASIAWRPVVDSQRSRPEVLLQEMISRYSGHVVVGRDLDVY